MSNLVTSVAQRRKVGSATKKAVLVYCADKASDDGSGIWTSKAHISDDTELSKRSVQRAITDLVADGILIERGKRVCDRGFTVEYSINLEALNKLEETRKSRGDRVSPVTGCHPKGCQGVTSRGDRVSPKPPLEPPLEPSNVREDLFYGDSKLENQEPPIDLIEEGFEEFWSKIWPSHSRKTGKADCRKVYQQACSGKHPKADQISPADLNAATRSYISSVQDQQFLKGPLPWLRQPGWEPFIGQAEAVPLSRYQEIIRRNGGRV